MTSRRTPSKSEPSAKRPKLDNQNESSDTSDDDIIDTTLYLVELQKNTAAMAKVKDEFIKAPYPASTWIGITELVIPGARAEIKVIARKPK